MSSEVEPSATALVGKSDADEGAADKTDADEADGEKTDGEKADGGAKAPTDLRVPELHSGHKLAKRYRLEECVTRLDGFSSWRAVDEKLRRAVGVHVLPAGHARARQVLAAARSAALLGDPRFVQVLDAVEEGELVYVVHEWLPDAVPLSELLTAGPLEPHEAYQLVSQLSQALTAAHREGLAHLRLTPSCVLRTGMGQYRIRGLAVNAALRGVTSDHPQRDDTEAIGALLYAALTQRWPYEEDAHGLPGVGSLDLGTLVAPEQLRAGVHRGLSTLAMRALVNDGATASRQEQPCTTPEELSKAVSALPRIRPPEPSFATPTPYQRPAYQQGGLSASGGPGGAAPGGPAARRGAEAPPPPTLPGRTGKVLKWGVSALLIAALGLGSWQVADALLKGEPSTNKKTTKQVKGPDNAAGTGKPVAIEDVHDFDPESSDGREKPERANDAVDGKPGTYWLTDKYIGHATFGNLKSGAGLILDLGKARQVSRLKVDFIGKTSASFLAAPSSVTNRPSSLSSFSKVTSGSGNHLVLKAKKPIKTRYVLLWLTKLPLTDDGNYRGRVTEVQVLG
ncbi:protein kinase family protein [Streptomyces oryzae]|uniref:protein kinase family protein n=1 Tax=Streptomyces oryzae TaxID=1434886 RepID=UPI001FFDF5CB